MSESRKTYTPAEYYEREAQAESKSDYLNGEILPSDGGGPIRFQQRAKLGGAWHSRVRSNIIAALQNRVADLAWTTRGYGEHGVEIARLGDPPSNAIALFDFFTFGIGDRASIYRRIDSTQHVVLVSLDCPHVEAQSREPDGRWTLRDYDNEADAVRLHHVGTDLPLAEIYEGIIFEGD